MEDSTEQSDGGTDTVGAPKENGFFLRWVLGRKKHSRTDSNSRRAMSRFSVFLSAVALIALASFQPFPKSVLVYAISVFLIAWAVAFFIFVIAAIPFRTNKKFIPNAARLFSDGLISIFQMIVVFAVYYSISGIHAPDWEPSVEWFDYVYFSAVTFSTLGFGDFSPVGSSRPVAALQAIIGNLHLGIVVGAMYFAAVELQLKSENSE